MKKIIVLAVIALFSANFQAVFAAPEPLPEELRLLSKKGIDSIYAVDLPEAKSAFEQAVKKFPEHPYPHFGVAMTKWAELEASIQQ